MPDTAVIWYTMVPLFRHPEVFNNHRAASTRFFRFRVVARDRKIPRVLEVGQSVRRKREREPRSRVRWMLPGSHRRAPMNLLGISHVAPAVFRIVAIYSHVSGKFGCPDVEVLNPLLENFKYLTRRIIYREIIDFKLFKILIRLTKLDCLLIDTKNLFYLYYIEYLKIFLFFQLKNCVIPIKIWLEHNF